MLKLKSETRQFVKYLGELSTYEVLQCIFSGVFGIAICVFTSAIVNTTLVEISINIIFAFCLMIISHFLLGCHILFIIFYFGICFLMIGILLMMRIQSLPDNSEMGKRKPFLFIFSCLVLVSGTFCFFLEDNWFIKLPPFEKGPIYTIISMSLNFCVIFSIVDLMNFFMGFCQKSHQKTMVETPMQIAVTLVLSVTMGLFYGIIFSVFDLEDQRGSKLDSQLIQDEYYCIPFACLFGFIGGFMNELLRIRGDYLPIIFARQEDPFNQEI